ncbi:MAG TPA: fibronectin type III domain-containing protein [Candidatus Limnocylindrales bacterium]|jgi:hypothetical protein|nr:fibronectin type III domain-containing protein [Candidatus Limnocylindrales bacterium]
MVCRRSISVFLVNVIFIAVSVPIYAAVPGASQSATLAWTPSQASTIAGYRLYYGGASQTYTNTVEVGNTTSVTVSNLAVGGTYFFAVTAYDLIGLESEFSQEISYTVPASARLALRALVAGQMLVTGRGPVGYQYDIQTSTDCQNWAVAGNATMDGTGTFQFTDPGAATNSSRYYRLRQSSP